MTPQLQQVGSMVKEAGKSITLGSVKTASVCFILYVAITNTAPALFEKGMGALRTTIAEHNATLERISARMVEDRREVIGNLTATLERTNNTIEKNTEVIGANTVTLQETKSVLWRINNKLEKADQQGMVGPPTPTENGTHN